MTIADPRNQFNSSSLRLNNVQVPKRLLKETPLAVPEISENSPKPIFNSPCLMTGGSRGRGRGRGSGPPRGTGTGTGARGNGRGRGGYGGPPRYKNSLDEDLDREVRGMSLRFRCG